MTTVASLAADLATGRTTSRALVEDALARIADPAGEGARTFMKVYVDTARLEADHADRLRAAGIVRSAVDGLPISVKDLYDVAGDVTRAGSRVLEGELPAKVDAPAVARLRAAGAIIIGRTNMTEFAFGGIGTNPHYGTPRNPWDRESGGRIPGGSSSGAAVAIADGIGVMGLGSDTRGSVRMPAALCGVAGFKPTTRRIPREGAFPLSYTLDSVGPLARSIECCAAFDAVLAGEPSTPRAALSAKGLRLMVPRAPAIEALDREVGNAFTAALGALSAAGAHITEVRMPAFDRNDVYFKSGGFSGAESVIIHKRWLHRLAEYDPSVAARITLGKTLSAADYIEITRIRETYIEEVGAAMAPFDAMLMPTVPCIAPTIAAVLGSNDVFGDYGARIVRHCGFINYLDGCASTLPCHPPGTAPVGLMVAGVAMQDHHILAVSSAIERVLRRG
jgi:aspartyl-tRNA(Asn)/glutamyl-tRNA(Gln) amidotransferase subunit A